MSGADSGDLEVLVLDQGVGVGVRRYVGAGPKGGEIGGQGGLAGFIEAGKGHLGGSEVFAEEVDRTRGADGHVEVDGDELGFDVGEEGG